MGCFNSKDRRAEPTLKLPITQSYSIPVVHRPAEKKGDSYHVVTITSSIDSIDDNADMEGECRYRKAAERDQYPHGLYNLRRSLDISSEMAAKTWSEVNNLLQNYKPFRSPSKSPSQRIDESVAKASGVSTNPRKLSLSLSPVKTAKKQRTPGPPGGENKVVLYFTSLRGIRKTFEDCCAMKMILQGFRVRVDERDISMHALFRQELEDLVGKNVTVPRLFIGGKYIGGVEEIEQLHEVGELAKYLEGFPLHTCFEPCEGCGDVCFVPCHNCNGSRKIFRDDGAIVRCWQCNENGLIRCPICCC